MFEPETILSPIWFLRDLLRHLKMRGMYTSRRHEGIFRIGLIRNHSKLMCVQYRFESSPNENQYSEDKIPIFGELD